MFKKRLSPEYAMEWRIVSLAIAIPLLLGAGPVVGYFLGAWLGGLLRFPVAGGVVGIAIGFAAGIRETVGIVRLLMALTKMKSLTGPDGKKGKRD